MCKSPVIVRTIHDRGNKGAKGLSEEKVEVDKGR